MRVGGARGRVIGKIVFAVALLGCAVAPVVARAAGSSIDDEKQARSLYERAEKSFDLGRFGEALADYQSAYEAKPLPGFLFNMAQCYRNLASYERARFFFRRYLALEPRSPNRRRVEELIAEMSKQLDAQSATMPATAPGAGVGGRSKPGDAPPTVVAPLTPPAVTPPPLSSAVTPAPSGAVPGLVATAPQGEARRPVWKRWWFWTGLGAVVVGGVVATFLLTRPETRTPGSQPAIDARVP